MVDDGDDDEVRGVLPGRFMKLHRAWFVAAVSFIALVGAGSFRAAPSVLIDPLHEDFGWSRGTISIAVSVNLLLFGVMSPFAAALMDRFGIRVVVANALTMVAVGSGLTVFMTQPWQLVLCWGVIVGLGTGSMALVFVATVTSRWFVKRRGLVTGVLTAGSAAGQLVFLPLMAWLADRHSWKSVSVAVTIAALSVVPLVLIFMRNHPADVGTTPYGYDGGALPEPSIFGGNAARRAITALTTAAHTKTFWLLAGTFAICGASTNGLIGTHFIPATHDHGMPNTAAASLLAMVGIFDIIGTISSGWLTDRVDPRLLLTAYYAMRGVSLLFLPMLLSDDVRPPMVFFIVFYGLDWVATVPPTVALCRQHFGAEGAIVFGWVFASHQIGAAVVAFGAGFARDHLGSYDIAWYSAGLLCAIGAVMAFAIRGHRTPTAFEPAVAAALD